MPRFIELSHPLRAGMAPYPGLPVPRFGALLTHEQSRPRYEGKAEFYLGRIDMPCNAGTYLDAPFHRYREGEDLSQVALERVAALPGLALDATGGRAVSAEFAAEEAAGRAVLLRTGWDGRWDTERYWEPGPFLSADLLDRLLAARPALVGVDFWNVDDTENPARPAHTRLLAERILIVENMANLGALPRSGFRVYAAPLAISGGASAPLRAFAEFGPDAG